MNSQTRVMVGVLSAGVVALLIALVFSMADGMDGDHHDGDSYRGMMGAIGAMGDMDSAGMMTHMQDMMDDETFSRMQEHMANH